MHRFSAVSGFLGCQREEMYFFRRAEYIWNVCFPERDCDPITENVKTERGELSRMLQVRQLCKEYRTGDLVQKALDHVDLNLRDNEFVAILGPSGSGKTTLLNIIGGLDRYDSGDLIINGISTKKYKDRDWDSYRNHTIGFVFQSYNPVSYTHLTLPTT